MPWPHADQAPISKAAGTGSPSRRFPRKAATPGLSRCPSCPAPGPGRPPSAWKCLAPVHPVPQSPLACAGSGTTPRHRLPRKRRYRYGLEAARMMSRGKQRRAPEMKRAGVAGSLRYRDCEFEWSGREDSNFRPPAPHAGALPGCATPRIGIRRYQARTRGRCSPRSSTHRLRASWGSAPRRRA